MRNVVGQKQKKGLNAAEASSAGCAQTGAHGGVAVPGVERLLVNIASKGFAENSHRSAGRASGQGGACAISSARLSGAGRAGRRIKD